MRRADREPRRVAERHDRVLCTTTQQQAGAGARAGARPRRGLSRCACAVRRLWPTSATHAAFSVAECCGRGERAREEIACDCSARVQRLACGPERVAALRLLALQGPQAGSARCAPLFSPCTLHGMHSAGVSSERARIMKARSRRAVRTSSVTVCARLPQAGGRVGVTGPGQPHRVFQRYGNVNYPGLAVARSIGDECVLCADHPPCRARPHPCACVRWTENLGVVPDPGRHRASRVRVRVSVVASRARVCVGMARRVSGGGPRRAHWLAGGLRRRARGLHR